MKPNNQWKKTIRFPLWQRGTEGDFCFPATFKSPPPPFGKVGNRKDFRTCATCLLLTLFSFFPTAHAGELGRLFFSPQQRQQLEFQETNNNGENSRRNYIIVNGIVQKQGGNRTVWINGAAQTAERGNDNTPATAPVTVPGKSRPVQLKVGQKLLLDTSAPEEEK